MCVEVVERFAVCRCIYYRHSVDACPNHQQKGHKIKIREFLVRSVCIRHTVQTQNQDDQASLIAQSPPVKELSTAPQPTLHPDNAEADPAVGIRLPYSGVGHCGHCSTQVLFATTKDLCKHIEEHMQSRSSHHEDRSESKEGDFSSKKDRDVDEARDALPIHCLYHGCDQVFSKVEYMNDHNRKAHRGEGRAWCGKAIPNASSESHRRGPKMTNLRPAEDVLPYDYRAWDSLSTTASIIIMTQMAGRVIQYLRGVKGAPKEHQVILNELIQITRMLYVLKDQADQDEDDDFWNATLRVLNMSNGPIVRFRAALDTLWSKLAPVEGWKKLGKPSIWPFQKKDIEDFLVKIERPKSIFNLAIKNDHIMNYRSDVLEKIKDGIFDQPGTDEIRGSSIRYEVDKLSFFLGTSGHSLDQSLDTQKLIPFESNLTARRSRTDHGTFDRRLFCSRENVTERLIAVVLDGRARFDDSKIETLGILESPICIVGANVHGDLVYLHSFSTIYHLSLKQSRICLTVRRHNHRARRSRASGVRLSRAQDSNLTSYRGLPDSSDPSPTSLRSLLLLSFTKDTRFARGVFLARHTLPSVIPEAKPVGKIANMKAWLKYSVHIGCLILLDYTLRILLGAIVCHCILFSLAFMSRRNSNLGPSGTWLLVAFVSSSRSLSVQLLSVASASAVAHHSWWCVVGYTLMKICIPATKDASLDHLDKQFSGNTLSNTAQYHILSMTKAFVSSKEQAARPFKQAMESFTTSSRVILSALGRYKCNWEFSCRRPSEPPLINGRKRIRWTCRCGHRLYDDFRELRPGAAEELQKTLNERSPAHGRSGNPSNYTVLSWSSSRASSLLSLLKVQWGKPQQSESLPVREPRIGQDQDMTTHCIRCPDHLFLLLCIPHRKYATKLVHMDVCIISSDQLFFANLKVHYQLMRGRWVSFFSIRKLKCIRFVQFEVYKSELVDIRKINDIPPETKKDEYRYRPLPAEVVPPVGENHMMHLYENPEDADDTAVCLDRVPKKLRERLLVSPQRGTGLGWGIHFVEGLHWMKLWILGLTGLLASVLFGVLWSTFKNDVQGGFGIAACLMVGLTFTTGILQAALEPK